MVVVDIVVVVVVVVIGDAAVVVVTLDTHGYVTVTGTTEAKTVYDVPATRLGYHHALSVVEAKLLRLRVTPAMVMVAPVKLKPCAEPVVQPTGGLFGSESVAETFRSPTRVPSY